MVFRANTKNDDYTVHPKIMSLVMYYLNKFTGIKNSSVKSQIIHQGQYPAKETMVCIDFYLIKNIFQPYSEYLDYPSSSSSSPDIRIDFIFDSIPYKFQVVRIEISDNIRLRKFNDVFGLTGSQSITALMTWLDIQTMGDLNSQIQLKFNSLVGMMYENTIKQYNIIN